ncbi:F-box protein SKIP23-like [Quercus lobata]|uniref:KIB1-4 beta-propeller domain-containing protein n=1 Tax=Quercus lobata TaxID=97700 RepID=A0A7N2MYX8_QUELO|nr:F-box protein SKIP23-like [Quercus lobata]
MADWSQLPKDLLDLIAKQLDSPFYQLNKLRLRSVCSSWRSSISDHRPSRRRLPFLPNDGFITTHQSTFAFHLSKRTIFLITLPTDNSNSWLIKTEEYHPSQMQLINPLSSTQIKSLPLDSPKVINLLNFRILELGHEYVLHYMNFKPFGNSSLGDVSSLYMEKVVYIRLGSENETDDFALLTIHVSGKLAMFKSGNKNWCIIADMPLVHDVLSPYDDVALFRGEFYAVDNTGRTVLVGLSSNLSLVAGSVFGGDKKFLVESVGQLLLVDMYLSAVFDDVDGGAEDVDEAFLDGTMGERTVRFKVFGLDWEGKKWVEVKSLGDRVLFLGDNCTFSAPASVLSGCRGNCIFFTGNFNRNCEEGGSSDGVFRNREIGVCDLDSGSIKPLGDYPEYSKLFWPPPAWVASTTLGVQNEFEELRL